MRTRQTELDLRLKIFQSKTAEATVIIGSRLENSKLWGRVSINADNDYCWTFPTNFKSAGYIALSTDVEGDISLVQPIGLNGLYVNRLQFAKVTYQQVYAFVIGV